MRFTIVTPSFRSSQWLRLCIASVADQGVDLEHIVQDSCSNDGTQDWLPQDRRVRAVIEKDGGMYDAINRGFSKASGDILAYLNCDEQYLPGALDSVRTLFESRPELDVVLSDTVVTNSAGDYLCHRFSLVPTRTQMWVRFPVLTCALFVRRRVVKEMGLGLDTSYRDIGDWYWVMAMVERGLRMAVLPRFTSVFADTGENMNLKPNALRERKEKWEKTPAWVKPLKPAIIAHTRWRILLRQPLPLKPFEFALYTVASPDRRVARRAERPTSFWPGR